MGLGLAGVFRVEGLGLRVQGLGFRRTSEDLRRVTGLLKPSQLSKAPSFLGFRV